MIKSIKPLTLAEVRDTLSSKEEAEKAKEVVSYIKRFTKLSPEQVKNMRQGIEQLGLIKLKEEHIAKIIDIMPADPEDVRKIFVDMSLDENEITKILEVTKKYL